MFVHLVLQPPGEAGAANTLKGGGGRRGVNETSQVTQLQAMEPGEQAQACLRKQEEPGAQGL